MSQAVLMATTILAYRMSRVNARLFNLCYLLDRNERDFCALYADAVAFTRPDDFLRRKFRKILVVDTQGILSTRVVDSDL